MTAPDAFFLCAGSSRPSYFVENTEEHLLHGMEQAYWVQAWSAHAAVKRLVHEGRPGKIVFVGSTVSIMSFIGYAPYAPGKHALKGLAETLRSECVLYDIDVQIFFAPTMDSPGLVEELKTKPPLTKKIEDGDDVLSCDKAAAVLVKRKRIICPLSCHARILIPHYYYFHWVQMRREAIIISRALLSQR